MNSESLQHMDARFGWREEQEEGEQEDKKSWEAYWHGVDVSGCLGVSEGGGGVAERR